MVGRRRARYGVAMTDAASLARPDAEPAPSWADAAEARVLAAARTLVMQGAPWNATLVRRAAALAGLSAADGQLLLPQGARDLSALLWREHDAAALRTLAGLDPAAMKVRERIRSGVIARMDAAMADRAAVEAASRFLARPSNAPLAAELGWGTADRLWRWAGDTATDANHYSKRALLWGVMASTLAARLSRGEAASLRTLDARLADVMKIETWKARLPPVMDGLTVLAAQLGRLRYPGRA